MPFQLNDFDDWVEYIPDVGDNRDLDVPMTVEISPLSTAETEQVKRVWGPKLQGKKAISRGQALVQKLVKEHARNIQNCYVYNHTTGARVDITTVDQLLAIDSDGTVIDDIFSAINKKSHLSEGLKKKSQSQSDSSLAGIQPSDGTAEAASGRAASKPSNAANKPYSNSGDASIKLRQTQPGDSPLV